MRYLFYCIKKLFRSPAFWASVLGTAAVCLCSEIYYAPNSDVGVSVIGMYLQFSRKAFLEDISLSSYAVFSSGFGTWAAMFAPVIAALAAISICVDERKSGMWRFSLRRSGRASFCGGSCAFVLISGGLTLLLGYGLFGILTAVMFPPLSAYSPENVEMFTWYTFREGSAMAAIFNAGGLPLCAAATLGETFLFGMVSAAAAMFISSFCENKYIVICVPFFLKYTLAMTSNLLFIKAFEDPMNPNEGLAGFANLIEPNGIKHVLGGFENVISTIIINAAFICVTVLCYCVIKGRRLKNEA